jgi:hypothetical protein
VTKHYPGTVRSLVDGHRLDDLPHDQKAAAAMARGGIQSPPPALVCHLDVQMTESEPEAHRHQVGWAGSDVGVFDGVAGRLVYREDQILLSVIVECERRQPASRVGTDMRQVDRICSPDAVRLAGGGVRTAPPALV